MSNLKRIGQGVGTFFMGYFLIVITYSIIPTLITIGESVFPEGTDLSGIIWLLTIIIWILMIAVMPVYLQISGIQEETGRDPKWEVIAGILIFIISILLTYKGWYLVTAMASMAEHTLILVLFYTGLILTWFMTTIITPVALIVKGTKH